MTTTYDMHLKRKAKGSGADQYVAPKSAEGFNVYIPQKHSRRGAKEPAKRVRITIEMLDDESSDDESEKDDAEARSDA